MCEVTRFLVNVGREMTMLFRTKLIYCGSLVAYPQIGCYRQQRDNRSTKGDWCCGG